MYQTLGYSITAAFLIAYIVHFKSFMNALERHSNLTDLLYNPNARVAAGDRAKDILKQLKHTQK
jgi:hypothetical protein